MDCLPAWLLGFCTADCRTFALQDCPRQWAAWAVRPIDHLHLWVSVVARNAKYVLLGFNYSLQTLTQHDIHPHLQWHPLSTPALNAPPHHHQPQHTLQRTSSRWRIIYCSLHPLGLRKYFCVRRVDRWILKPGIRVECDLPYSDAHAKNRATNIETILKTWCTISNVKI